VARSVGGANARRLPPASLGGAGVGIPFACAPPLLFTCAAPAGHWRLAPNHSTPPGDRWPIPPEDRLRRARLRARPLAGARRHADAPGAGPAHVAS
jgi:hypothetical protein